VRRLVTKVFIAGFAEIVVAAGFVPPASTAGQAVTSGKKAFSGNVCGIPSSGELAAAHIEDPCHKVKTAKVPVKKSPLGGTVGSVEWGGRWGKPTNAGMPSHYLGVLVTRELGSGRALELFEKKFRLSVIGNGAPINVGKGTASMLTETASCPNPPTSDCTKGTVLAIVGRYVVEIFLNDFPPTIPGASEEGQGEDDAEDMAQEELIKPVLREIANSVVAKL